MKYVAFLDILGFKDKLKKMNQNEAAHFIGAFSTTAFQQWEAETVSKLNGYIVSDSFIIYSNDVSCESLQELIKVIDKICKKEFAVNGILLRGAIAKGNFEKLEAREISTLQKGLIVGQAYVDAYLLEGTVKTTGIVLSEEVYQDITNIGLQAENVLRETINKTDHYILRYLTLDFLLDQYNLKKFVELANESSWLPHYFNTLYFALKQETNDKKATQLFINLLELVGRDSPNENWRDIDTFIKNVFNPNVILNFQTRFLKYIRKKLLD